MSRPFSKRFRPAGLSLKDLRDLFGTGNLLPTEADYCALGEAGNSPRLFLGNYSEDDILERLAHYGVMPKLREKGFGQIRVRLDLSNLHRQEVFLYDGEFVPSRLLGELAVQPGIFRGEHSLPRALRGRTFHMLYIHWLCLQNPTRSFTASRPALPGQRHPGLKVGHEFMHMLIALAQKLGMDGIINVPEFPHTAVFYSRRFAFLSPTAEGVLRAFQRDMAEYSLARASWGILTGCVKETRTARPRSWFSGEQVLPVSQALIDHFYGDWYTRRVQRSFESHRFTFDEAHWERCNPLNPDGSPRYTDEQGGAIPRPELPAAP